MIVLRGTDLSMNLINEAIFVNISANSELTYGQIGRVVMVILGSGKLTIESFVKIVRCFGKNSQWMTFIQELRPNLVSDVVLGFERRNVDVTLRQEILVGKFHEALEDTYFANWKLVQDYISPACFLYLLERLLLMVSHFQGYFFTTKASFVELLIFQKWTNHLTGNLADDMKLSLDLGDIHTFMENVILELLLNMFGTMEWIKSTKDNLKDCHSLLFWRLIVLVCLVCINSGKHFDKLFTLLDRKDITSQLPLSFSDAICRGGCYFVDALADALKKIENPLVVVGVGDKFSKFPCLDAFFVNLKENKCSREDVIRELFPEEGKTPNSLGSVGENDSSYPFSNHSCGLFWGMFDALDLENERGGNGRSLMSVAPKIKVEVEKSFQLLSAAMNSFAINTCEDDENFLVEANSMLDDLKQLSFVFDTSERELEDKISTISELLKRLRLRRPRLEPFLDLLLQNGRYTADEPLKSSIASEAHNNEYGHSKAEGDENKCNHSQNQEQEG